MLTTNPSVPIYLHSESIDMRKSFDGLFGIIKSDLNVMCATEGYLCSSTNDSIA